jgi:hypothetical protein
MSRSNGTYTAPTSGFKPAVEGAVVDSSDWNTLLDDLEAAVTETVYTGGLGAVDNAMVRTDGTDTKKAQGSTPTISDTGAISGVATITLTSYTVDTLPSGAEGQIAFASDAIGNGGASTGSLVFYDGEAWRGVDTGSTASESFTLEDDDVNAFEYMEMTFATSNGVTYELSFRVLKQSTTSTVGALGLSDNFITSWFAFAPDDGAVARDGAFFNTAGSADETTHWRFSIRFTATGSSHAIRFYPAAGTGINGGVPYFSATLGQTGSMTFSEIALAAV